MTIHDYFLSNTEVIFLSTRIWPQTDDPAREQLLQALYDILGYGKLRGHLTSTFAKLKLMTVKRVRK